MMKEYVKPEIQVIELRAEELLASATSKTFPFELFEFDWLEEYLTKNQTEYR